VPGAISDGRALPAAPGAGGTQGNKAATAKKAGAAKGKTVKRQGGKRKTTKRKAAAMAARSDVVRSARVAQAAKKRTATKRVMPSKSASKPAPSSAAKSGASPKAAGSRASGPPQPKPAIYQNPKAPDVLMIRAAAIAEFDLIGNWEHEMLKYGQAIIHDKIVVIDPLSDDCVVVTGSHNLGFKASYANDENLLVIRGNRALAVAYMVHILDVYDHYKFRAILEQQAYERAMGKPGQKPPVGQGILDVDDSWQDKYVNGKPTKQQAYFISGNMP
jgi:phosphatidylserine/phosphatidylglycerophosphate/cardiolipin synthase-like enzyme